MASKKVVKKIKAGAHVFIDTNILLNFYAYSKDDLDELEKLVKILKTKTIKLYLTQQVVDEVYRNREVKLYESFDSFGQSINSSCPRFMVSLAEYAPFKEALESYKSARATLLAVARALADARELHADELFSKILEQAEVIQVNDDAYAAAERRARLGNPPGKSPSTIGDQLNWELLLANVPKKSDLHLISKDGDYASRLNAAEPKLFLSDEWKNVNGGTLHLHEQINLFFKANYPDEGFTLEIEKRESIDALISSGNFATTHGAIAQLEPYVPFLTSEEAEEVIQGALSNSQVAWIASDSDVHSFLTKMLELHGDDLSAAQQKRLRDALGLDPEGSDVEAMLVSEDDIPF
jgi:PIN domain